MISLSGLAGELAKPEQLLLLTALFLTGCFSVPPGRAAIDRIEVRGEDALSEGELESLLASKQTPKALGIARGVFFEHELYDHHVLQMDLERVERIYRAHGYYHARVVSSQVHFRNEKHARVVIRVQEGEPTLLETVRLDGLPAVSPSRASRLRRSVKNSLVVGKPFREDNYEKAANSLLFSLRDLGFARAEIEQSAEVDLVSKEAHVTFVVKPGPVCYFGEIEIPGLEEEIPEARLRKLLAIRSGRRYSQSEIQDAQATLLALGVFSFVRIAPQLDDDPLSSTIPLVVETHPTSLRTLELGGGTQLDVIRTAVHGKLGWQSQNFLGGLRRFRAELKPGLVLYPTRLQALTPPTDLLPFVSAKVRLDQPALFGGRTSGAIGAQLDAYPLLLGPQVNEDAPVLGYAEEQFHLALERIWKERLFVSPKYSLIFAQPFTYRGELDPDLKPLSISSLELYGRYDTRDNLLFPSRGVAVSASVEVAGGPLGGQVSDVGGGPEVRAYVPVARGWTLALRGASKVLYPLNWGDYLYGPNGGPAAGASRGQWVRDTQISLFRSLFAGGPNSNRGYAQQGIGPHGVVPFFVPSVQGPAAAAVCESDPESDPSTCLLPLGGRTSWEATIEMRYPIVNSLYGAAFCDAADVAPGRLQYRFDRPHLSCGLGARYATPVGPLRFDVGYRIPGLQTLGSSDGEGVPPTLFGAPVAVAFSIGEAF